MIRGLKGISLVAAVGAFVSGCFGQMTEMSSIGTSAAVTCANPNVAKVATAHALSSYVVSDACSSASNYACESTTFGAASLSKGAEQQCASVLSLGQVCLTVDTTHVEGSSSRTIFHCSNTQLAGSQGYLFQTYASSLEAALSGAVSKCESRSL